MQTAREPCAVVVFAKAPVPGAVKTRLFPVLDAERAAALHAQLVERTLASVRAAAFARVELHCAPDAGHPFFQYCSVHYGVALAAQGAGTLGARMLAAFERNLAGCERVLLVGSDCPVLTATHLQQAERALREGADAVFCPCEDGGYALIGLTSAAPRLFFDIAWGGASVMADTRKRLAALGWDWRELDTLWDVDRPEDYERLLACGLLDQQD